MPSTRDTTARSRIRAHLRRHGPVEDAAGRATARLLAAVDYRGSLVAFIQLLTAMSKDAEIVREIRGKRTYRIALPEAVDDDPGINYQDVARRLLDAVGHQVRGPASGPAPTAAELAALRAERDRLLVDCARYSLLIAGARDELARLLGGPVEVMDRDPEVERAARQLLTGLRRGAAVGEQAG